MNPHYDDGDVTVYHGDCLDVLRGLPDASVDAVVTDPPYGLEFMGKEWDSFGSGAGIEPTTDTNNRDGNWTTPPFGGGGKRVRYGRSVDGMLAFQQWCQLWAAECLRVLRPGGHLLAFGGTRTYHRMACAIEDAGFEIRDSIHWTYGSGFPKSLDVSKAIDKAAGATREKVRVPPRPATSGTMAGSTDTRPWIEKSREVGYHEVDGDTPATDAARQWDGWGTALKPSHEPIVVARKPLVGTVAGNVLAHGTGAINVDGCRVAHDEPPGSPSLGAHGRRAGIMGETVMRYRETTAADIKGRWPANTILGHTPDCDPDGGCEAGCPCAEMDAQSGVSRDGVAVRRNGSTAEPNPSSWDKPRIPQPDMGYGGEGGASRFFPAFYYTAKASSAERPRGDGVAHPTVKPLDLMRWLVRLVTPPGGVVLEPFAGSGTTAEACVVEGFRCIAIEREADYLPLIVARLSKPIERTLL